MNTIIPLFPLSMVMFPSSKIPLHIFEERYKKMVNKCLAEKTGFGIAAQVNDEISKVGCYVEVSDILQKYPSGEMDIIVTGKSRFLVKGKKIHPDGYYLAKIEEYNDLTSEVSKSLLIELRASFKKIINKVNFKLEKSFWENFRNSKNKSFKIAEKSGLTLEQQQKLLTIRNENERIDFLLEHLEKLDSQLTENAALKALIMSDGYINL